jgi:hypothetical protein
MVPITYANINCASILGYNENMTKREGLLGKVVKSAERVLHGDFVEHFNQSVLEPSGGKVSRASLTALGDFEAVLKALKLNAGNILHSRETVTIFHEPPVEKVIQVDTKIKDLYEQQAGDKPMGFVVIEVSGKHNGKPVFNCERIWAVAGGFPRGQLNA